MRIVMVGAGVAGLAAAYGFQRAGAEVTLYERRTPDSTEGSGLSLLPNGMTALGLLGLGPAVADLTGGQGPSGGGQRTPDGRWVSRLGPDVVAGLRVVHRAELHRALVAALRPGTVRFGVTAQVMDPDEGRVAADGTEIVADLVVAADGINSATRRRLGLDPGLRWAGYGAWRGVAPSPGLPVEPSETWGRGQRFGLVPLPDGRVYWFAVESRRGAPSGDPRAHVLARFGGWHEPIASVIEATDPDAVAWTDICELARPLPTFTRGRVALIGDAAHAMTPNLGQGGNQALEDAATLVALFAPVAAAPSEPSGSPAGSAVSNRLASYDALRRPRTQAMARASRRLGAVAQASHPVLAAARDRLIGALPAAVAARQLRRLGDWSVDLGPTRR